MSGSTGPTGDTNVTPTGPSANVNTTGAEATGPQSSSVNPDQTDAAPGLTLNTPHDNIVEPTGPTSNVTGAATGPDVVTGVGPSGVVSTTAAIPVYATDNSNVVTGPTANPGFSSEGLKGMTLNKLATAEQLVAEFMSYTKTLPAESVEGLDNAEEYFKEAFSSIREHFSKI